jgi:N6-adenosine-specific RNA methylase IME4
MQHEVLLIAVHGDPITPREKDRPRSILRQKRSSKHSEKPEQVVKLIESMYPRLPKIELWARTARKGWAVWGNEA